jgi:hypothetical protein
MLSDKEVLKSVRAGKPPADSLVIGTWKLQSYVNRLVAGNVPSVVFDVPKSSPQIDMSAPGRSVRLHILAPPIHLYLVA